MKPKYIIIHHSASPQTQTAKAIDDYHKKLWNFKSSLGHFSGYQYIIEANGNVFQARADTEVGAHTIQEEMNYQSIGICIVGWYDDGHDSLPTKEQQISLGNILRDKMKEYGISRDNIRFHRDYAPKSCPGYHITQGFITKIINNMTTEHEKNYKKIAKALAKKIKYDYGENPNDKETKEILSDLDKLPIEVEKIVEKIVQVEKIKVVEVIKEKIVFKEMATMTLGDWIGQLVTIIKNKWNSNK